MIENTPFYRGKLTTQSSMSYFPTQQIHCDEAKWKQCRSNENRSGKRRTTKHFEFRYVSNVNRMSVDKVE